MNLIGGIVQGVGNVVGGLLQNRAQRKANEANMELAKYQHAKNLEMWNLTNEYNHPSAQMERLQSAGLNPNLVYGGGATTQATEAPQFQRPEIHPLPQPDVPNLINLALDMKAKEASINLVEEQRRNIIQRTINDSIAGEIAQLNKGILGVRANYAEELMNYTLQGKRLSNKSMEERINHTLELIKQSQVQQNFTNQLKAKAYEETRRMTMRNNMFEETGIDFTDSPWMRLLYIWGSKLFNNDIKNRDGSIKKLNPFQW